MSWARSKANAASDSTAEQLESQNEAHLSDLHSKLQALRGVTTDIYRDAQGQNTLLDGTSNAFESFRTSLSNTSTRFTRSVQTGKGPGRIQLGIVGGLVALYLLYRLFAGGKSDPL